ncbi:MAG TPA: hypothetical protein VEC12_02535, partial [Bacteroidia bacterium]|nr:hypothetical protein [Bacteroidia bacterium]
MPGYTPSAVTSGVNNNYALPPVAFKTSVQGTVTDIYGNPIARAVVSTSNIVVTTDDFGVFELSSAA